MLLAMRGCSMRGRLDWARHLLSEERSWRPIAPRNHQHNIWYIAKIEQRGLSSWPKMAARNDNKTGPASMCGCRQQIFLSVARCSFSPSLKAEARMYMRINVNIIWHRERLISRRRSPCQCFLRHFIIIDTAYMRG